MKSALDRLEIRFSSDNRLPWIAKVILATIFWAPTLTTAQALTDLHAFTNQYDGGFPSSTLAIDTTEKDLYGTAAQGGSSGDGTVFRLSNRGSGWTFTPLYSFTGGNDGSTPYGSIAIAPDGTLYGTTYLGGGGGCGTSGCGTVFRLQPPPSFCAAISCPWHETAIYRFRGAANGDGQNPTGTLIFDEQGNIYGTTGGGGIGCTSGTCGTVFELTPSGGRWTETVLHTFLNYGEGPGSGVIFDQFGNLYGTTVGGGNGVGGYGTVFELSPSGSGWIEQTLYSFSDTDDGQYPLAGVIFDATYSTLYGASSSGGVNGGGVVFSLTPALGNWTFTSLYSLSGPSNSGAIGPDSSLTMDASGDLYGTASLDGGAGLVFELTFSNGNWMYSLVHSFIGTDGDAPMGSVTLDSRGNLYGTAFGGGAYNDGVVWEITP